MNDLLKSDFLLNFRNNGVVDLDVGSGELKNVSGRDNLVQALKFLLLCDSGELSELGHPRYGTTIRDFLGEPLVRSNMELIRRIVRKAIFKDPRVEEVTSVKVMPGLNDPGAIYVEAVVAAIGGSEVTVDVTVS